MVDYAIAQGKRSFVALVPDNAYGSVVEAEFRKHVARKRRPRRRARTLRRPTARNMQRAVQNIAQAAARRRCAVHPGRAPNGPAVVQALAASGVNLKRLQLSAPACGTIRASSPIPALQGGWYRGAGSNGRLSALSPPAIAPAIGQDPVRTATLAYDAVALVAALVKTQGRGASPTRC